MATATNADPIGELLSGWPRRMHTTVPEYVAAPIQISEYDTPLSNEFAIEFFVPPAAAAFFERELERQLQRRSATYASGGKTGQFGAVAVHPVPSGTFHQWRKTWHSQQPTASQIWSSNRQIMEGILWQVRTGWNELRLGQSVALISMCLSSKCLVFIATI